MGNSYNTANCVSTRSLCTFGILTMPMNLAAYAKELDRVQKAPSNNVRKAQTPSASSSLRISPKTEENKFPTPWLSARSNLTKKIPIEHELRSQVVKFATPGMKVRQPVHSTSSNSSLTVFCCAAMHALYDLIKKTFTSKTR